MIDFKLNSVDRKPLMFSAPNCYFNNCIAAIPECGMSEKSQISLITEYV